MALIKKPDFKSLEKKLIDNQESKIRLLAFDIRKGIIARTLAGKSVEKTNMRKYSKGYARIKTAQYGSKTPNLFGTATTSKKKSSGHMLNDIIFKNIKGGVRFMFNSAESKAKAAGNSKTRKFFGMDKAQKQYVKSKLSKLK